MKPEAGERKAGIERWEEYYRETAQRDFERAIYKRCNEEDSQNERKRP